MQSLKVFKLSLLGALFLLAAAAAPKPQDPTANAGDDKRRTRLQVIVPEEDRFTPFALTVRSGDWVIWVNNDTDDHSIVSDDSFNTTGPRGLDIVLKGTDNNGGQPGRYQLHFTQPGTFLYHCRFHSHLDAARQPVAPGPEGGIEDPDGNHGTPMMGIITVLP
jgi:plastocyanin